MTPIPYGELDAVAGATRRTLVLRASCSASLPSAAAVAVVVVGRGEAAPPSPLPAGTDGLVVLDLSASISTDTYARIGATLDGLAETGGRYGLIVFSDTAYLALPPGTPAAELRAFRAPLRPPRADGRCDRGADEPVDRLVQRRDEDLDRTAARARHDQGRSGSVGRPCSSSATSTTTSATSSV